MGGNTYLPSGGKSFDRGGFFEAIGNERIPSPLELLMKHKFLDADFVDSKESIHTQEQIQAMLRDANKNFNTLKNETFDADQAKILRSQLEDIGKLFNLLAKPVEERMLSHATNQSAKVPGVPDYLQTNSLAMGIVRGAEELIKANLEKVEKQLKKLERDAASPKSKL